MRHSLTFWRRAATAALCVALGGALGAATRDADSSNSNLDQVLERVIAREQGLLGRLQRYQPLVETYLQSVKPDGVLGAVPVRDRYFLGRLNLGAGAQKAEKQEQPQKQGKPDKSKPDSNANLLDLYQYSAAANPDGFARMLTLDGAQFDREHYHFTFVRREFLGEVRTLVFDVAPSQVKGAKPGRFTGRIWVDDREYDIVRFNGLYGSIFATNLHFDSWRVNVGPGLWLPAYVYTEEPDRPGGDPKMKHKGQTRIWAYDVEQRRSNEEFTKVLIDAPLTHDESEAPGQVSPVESFRVWEREAEDNVVRRLERAGLLAPEGQLSAVLETVVSNLEVTNDLSISPEIRCRVLLTTPLESFTVGHTIVLSRGLIDVLPDEASLAMVLAHELGHIVAGHRLDTRYAFGDQMLVGDKQTLELFRFERPPQDEQEADERALALLEHSPYKDKLAGAGLFLRSLAAHSASLSSLVQPHFGNRVASADPRGRLTKIVDAAPALNPNALDQIAALPLGGRVKVNPWTGDVELMKSNRVALLSPREKLEFQITPLMPYLVRYDARPADAAQDAASRPRETATAASGGTAQKPR